MPDPAVVPASYFVAAAAAGQLERDYQTALATIRTAVEAAERANPDVSWPARVEVVVGGARIRVTVERVAT